MKTHDLLHARSFSCLKLEREISVALVAAAILQLRVATSRTHTLAVDCRVQAKKTH